MPMTPPLRRLVLTAHVASSVGWLGAVVAFLALAVTGLTGRDDELVGAAYLAMEVIGWGVIVPLSLASLATGVVQSLGTNWGLLRHYWVLAKLVLTVAATALLLLHMRAIAKAADIATMTTMLDPAVTGLRVQLAVDAGAAVLLLLATTTLSVYKPSGRTRFAVRRRRRRTP